MHAQKKAVVVVEVLELVVEIIELVVEVLELVVVDVIDVVVWGTVVVVVSAGREVVLLVFGTVVVDVDVVEGGSVTVTFFNAVLTSPPVSFTSSLIIKSPASEN